ncbi:hypothetical protein HT136_01725 [Novosphingobium profundi]|uniref:hypothetical protein n=1 Tax=Novosphingobium profundi TaxID=1774954 RepID=UPI001BD9160E|nr:hypothetical protein [Novosphingobium profundi]MBT0667086.1 hypothetical protein [Novosphingobium profundi]
MSSKLPTTYTVQAAGLRGPGLTSAQEALVAAASDYAQDASVSAANAAASVVLAAAAPLVTATAIENRSSPNQFPDFDMAGTVEYGWGLGNASTGQTADGRKTLTFGNTSDTLSVAFASLGLVSGDEFTVSFVVESLPGTVTSQVHLKQLTGGTTYQNQQEVNTSAAVTGPVVHTFTTTVDASATTWQILARNATISQVALYKGRASGYRPSFIGDRETVDQMLAIRQAQKDQFSAPNIWPDVDMLGVASGTTLNGWQSSLTAGVFGGRQILTATGATKQMFIPVADLGGVGATISASAWVHSSSGAGATSAVSISQIRANGTTISTSQLTPAYYAARGAQGSRLRSVSGVVISAECDRIAFNFGSATATIAFSLPSIQQGADPSWRPPRPDLEDMLPYISELFRGPTSGRPGDAPNGWRYFDTDLGYGIVADGLGGWAREVEGTVIENYDYYVDTVNGNDANDGKTKSTPFAKLSTAVAALGATTGLSIGIARGSVLRVDPITLAVANTRIGAYGSEELGRPKHLGSLATAVSAFTKVGNLYSIALAFTPRTLAIVKADGTVRKLYMTTASDTDSAVDPTQEAEFTWFPSTHATYPNTLKFYSSEDWTGASIEIPQGGTATPNYGIDIDGVGGSGCTVSGIDVMFWNQSGMTWDSPNVTVDGVNADYNGGDGFDQHPGATGFVLRGDGLGPKAVAGRGWYNGRYRAQGNGPGDGTSAHAAGTGAAGSILAMSFKGNTQTGIGNQCGCTIQSYGCYLEDNYFNLMTYNDASNIAGTHTHDYLISVSKGAEPRNLPFQWYASNATDGAKLTVNVKIRNATVYFTSGSANSAKVSGFTNRWDNIVAVASGVTTAGFYLPASNVMQDNNCTFYGFSSVFNASGIDSTAANRLTTNPLLIDPANGNFGLGTGSPAIASGLNAGLAKDYRGNSVPASPDRGALQRL